MDSTKEARKDRGGSGAVDGTAFEPSAVIAPDALVVGGLCPGVDSVLDASSETGDDWLLATPERGHVYIPDCTKGRLADCLGYDCVGLDVGCDQRRGAGGCSRCHRRVVFPPVSIAVCKQQEA